MTARILQRLFEQKNIPADAKKILDDFDLLVQRAMPANSRQLVALPKQIRGLSHQMTDERGSRRLGYMNDTAQLSAYARYFVWWNLVRLTRLFCNLDFSFLRDGDACLDIGSGPLTLPCALWLSRPDLREKKLVWTVMDISHGALSLGEEIYLSVVATTGGEPWKINKVKGPLGTATRQKARFVSCANMFNEVIQSQGEMKDFRARPLSRRADRNATEESRAFNGAAENDAFLAKKHSSALFNYLDISKGNRSAILLVEPGVPKSARFVSFMRDAFIERGFKICAPCPHQGECPMDGRRAGQKGAGGKWCNFAFETEGAPKKLLALSEKAGLAKERAVMSFVMAECGRPQSEKKDERSCGKKMEARKKACASPRSPSALLRIASDIIRVPAKEPGGKTRIGHYACSDRGLVLALSSDGRRVYSGDLLELPAACEGLESVSQKNGRRDFGRANGFDRRTSAREIRDSKTGALVVEI